MTLDAATQAVKSPEPASESRGKATTPRFVVVDALRGISALWVVVCHAVLGRQTEALNARLPEHFVDLMRQGGIPVSIFFVLSGYVIAFSVARYEVNARFVGRFALRRSIRLDPPYWASILLTVGLGYVAQFFIANRVYKPLGTWRLAAHFVYLQSFFRFEEINPAYWTLPYEIQFYLVFCLLLFVAHRTRRDASDRRSTFAIFIPILILSSGWPMGVIDWEPYPGCFLRLWYGFLIGMTACWAMLKVIPNWMFYAHAYLLCLAVIVRPDLNVITCVGTAMLLFLAARLGKLSTWLNYRWLLFLGSISYSLYLIHNPITGAFYRFAFKLTGRGVVAEAAWFLPMILCNVACAYIFWWLFERTSIAFGHRIRMNKPSKPEPPEIEPASSRA